MTEAPRWRLMTSHYLNVPGTEWEHNESDRTTGKAVRKLYTVPALLDPRNPNDCNRDGECVVAHAIDGLRNERSDVIFLGDPTPDMEPINDEAEEISNGLKAKWTNPIETLPANGGMNDQEKAFMEKMMKAFAGTVQAQNQPIPNAEVNELKDRLAKLEALLVTQAKPAVERRA